MEKSKTEKEEKQTEKTKNTVSKRKVKKEEVGELVREIIVEKRVGFNFLEVILIMIITLVIGVFCGSIIHSLKAKDPVERTVVVKESDDFSEFVNVYNDIKANYYQDIDEEALIEAGIKGMVNFLGDKYSLYMEKSESDSFNETVDGYYNGIGIEFSQIDGKFVVLGVFSNSPAEKNGIKPDDIIVSVDGEEFETISDLVKSIKNSGKKEVVLKILRNNEELDMRVPLGMVNIESVAGEVIEKDSKKIGYIYLSVFANNTYSQFEDVLNELEEKNIDSLIIDVRGNMGGYLSCVNSILSKFIEKDKVLYKLDTKGDVEAIKDATKESRKYDVVILVDKASASASEILAAGMQESYGAKVIGTSTYGKGTVQKAYELNSGSTIKYTIQKWLTPNGNWIEGKGVNPDIEVELTDEYAKNPINDNDAQLQEALKELSK